MSFWPKYVFVGYTRILYELERLGKDGWTHLDDIK